MPSRRPPRWLCAIAAVYAIASFVHFTHNAEYIAFYPNMPAWLTREQVYLAWLAVTGVGVVGVALHMLAWPLASALLLGAYGALGFGGLGHYTLAACAEHTLAQHLTIWFEVLTGAALLAGSAWYFKTRM